MINKIKKWWYSSDREMKRVRNAYTNQELAKIVKRCDYYSVLELAVSRINDQAILEDIAKNHKEWKARTKAVEKLTNQEVLAHIAQHDSDNTIRNKALEKLDINLNRDLLEELVDKLEISYTRYTIYKKMGYAEKALRTFAEMKDINAIKQIEDQEFLAYLYRKYNEYRIQIVIVGNINDQYWATELLKFNILKDGVVLSQVSDELLKKIDNQDLLGELFRLKKDIKFLKKMDVNYHRILFFEVAKSFDGYLSEYAALQLGDNELLAEVKNEIKKKKESIDRTRNTAMSNLSQTDEECKCLRPSLYDPPGGWTICRICGKRHGEYNWNWDSIY